MNAVSTAADQYATWQNILAPPSKLSHIPCIKPYIQHSSQICLTCPMSKFTKLPYTLSTSHASTPFALIHIDIWGPYKTVTKGRYRYFLTTVDDCSRMTWFTSIQI